MPKMGDIVQTSKDEYSGWTGGKPKPDWSGLDATAPKMFKSPCQLRPMYAKSQIDAFTLRRKGLEVKFAVTDDLSLFEDKVWKHLLDTGMDTISYLPDVEDSTVMTSVVHGHSRFTLEYTEKSSKELKKEFDLYDDANDAAATQFLLNSLSPELEIKLAERMGNEDSFTVAWIRLISSITSTSIDKYDDIKNRIKARSPDQYPGQDLEKLGTDYRKDAKILEAAGQYDHSITLHMLKTFLKAGGDGIQAENFRHPLRNMQFKLDAALLTVAFKDKAATKIDMIKEELTYKDVCD
jgi:hypothetical protein